MCDEKRVAVICEDCGKILRWLDFDEEAAEKKIMDVKTWHSGICWKKRQLRKPINSYRPSVHPSGSEKAP